MVWRGECRKYLCNDKRQHPAWQKRMWGGGRGNSPIETHREVGDLQPKDIQDPLCTDAGPAQSPEITPIHRINSPGRGRWLGASMPRWFCVWVSLFPQCYNGHEANLWAVWPLTGCWKLQPRAVNCFGQSHGHWQSWGKTACLSPAVCCNEFFKKTWKVFCVGKVLRYWVDQNAHGCGIEEGDLGQWSSLERRSVEHCDSDDGSWLLL